MMHGRRRGMGMLAGTAALLAIGAAGSDAPPMPGFAPAAAGAQSELETRFKALPATDSLRAFHRELSREPHPAGSARNNELAEWVAAEWHRQGWEEVQIHRYDVLTSSPRAVEVEMVAPVSFHASLREDPYEVDPDTANPRVDSAYLAMSASGEVTAPLVYAHSGNPEDYEHLRRQGIDVRGKVVIVRYSMPYSYRGFKALTAERMGAAAILIYSDPKEDGYIRGKTFPDGPWGPESHIQRGAITYDFLVAGDPLTPGWASVSGARRIRVEEAVSVPKIIAVPLSWRDAKPLLENLDGPEAPGAWQGGLPIRYRLGGGRVRVRVKADMDTSVRPNYVVEARLRGAALPDEWVVMGSHRDAWAFGAVDASSGHAALLELTRALGELKRRGLRPRRTIIACSWDGEEVALTTSTEWGEQFAGELQQKAVAYINVDPGVSGPDFQVTAVPSLAPLAVEVSRGIEHPSGESLYEAWRKVRGEALRQVHPPARLTEANLVETRVGSGSDHTVFLNHLGIPVILPEFTGPYGVYHSMYDNSYWMDRFGDPGFRVHRALTQYWGVLALRLANAEVVPFDFAAYGRVVAGFLAEATRSLASQSSGTPEREDWKHLLASAEEFTAAGFAFDEALRRALRRGPLEAEAAAEVNATLRTVERNWLDPAGLPGRPWFRHALYATRYTYASLVLPGLTEAIEHGDAEGVARQVRILADALRRNVSLLRATAARLEPARPAAAR